MDISAVTRTAQSPDLATPAASTENPTQTRDVIQAVKALNATEMFGDENQLTFHMDQQSRRMVIQIVNRNTKEVISQIPAEYLLALSEDLKKRQKASEQT
jgi:flagellar protein FlaG